MEKDSIITLDDNTEYALLDETTLNNKKYFFAVLLDSKSGNPTTKYEIFEEEIDGNDTYMNTLEESDFKQAVLVEFTNNYMKNVEEKIEEN